MPALKIIPLSKLQLGSYVVRVVKSKGILKVKKSGYVKKQTVLNSLLEQGILEVEIDEDLFESIEPTPPVPEPEEKPKLSYEEQVEKATIAFEKGQKLQRQAFKRFNQSQELDLEQIKKIVQNLILAVEHQPDTATFLAQLQQANQLVLEHSLRCTNLMIKFAQHLQYEPLIIESLAIGALLHDIGQYEISSDILNKKATLIPEEQAIFIQHVVHAQHVLSTLPDLDPITIQIVCDHHEYLDGTGYPTGKAVDTNDLYPQMMTIIDLYDELTHPYHQSSGLGPLNALRQLQEKVHSCFSDSIFQHFVKCIGFYPAGTWIRLKSGRVGIVVKTNSKKPKHPKLKIVYHAKHQRHIEPKIINLGSIGQTEEIEACIHPKMYDLDPKDYL